MTTTYTPKDADGNEFENLGTYWLSIKEEKRLEKIKSLIKQLEEGEHIQNRQLKTWLTEEQFEGMNEAWEREKAIKEKFKNKPKAIKEYERLIQKATFTYNKSESKRFEKSSKQLYDKTEGMFETALEHIKKQVALNSELVIWLDRNPSDNKDISLSPIGMPKVITSRSVDNTSGVPSLTIREVKIEALEKAAEQLETNPMTEEERKEWEAIHISQTTRLLKKMKQMGMR